VEEQGAAGGAKRQVTQFVEDDEIRMGKPRRDLSRLSLLLFLLKSIDEKLGQLTGNGVVAQAPAIRATGTR